jgi:hypothetical protein
MDAALRSFLANVEALGPSPDRTKLSEEVSVFAAETDYWHYYVARAGSSSIALHRPDKGVQVNLVHRTDGTMSYIHSHSVWVALSAIVGVETHRQYEVEVIDDDHAHVTLADECQLRGGSGDVVTLTPPHDVHSHGHLHGSGDWPYTLIVLGDNQLRYRRHEFDLASGRRRALLPGERGTIDLPNDA